MSDRDDFDEMDDFDEGDEPAEGPDYDDLDDDELLDEHETAMVRQDLVDLTEFESTFGADGFRGVSMFCQDCMEEHYFPWDMLRENLELLLETGETPVHEPAFQPDPEQYVPWEYARGYVDALRDVGVGKRIDADVCSRCGFKVPPEVVKANFCPRCGTQLLTARLAEALSAHGLTEQEVDAILRNAGIPG